MKHTYYIIDPKAAMPLLTMKMLSSYSFKEDTLEDGTKVYGWMEFDGELSNKCIEISKVVEKEEQK